MATRLDICNLALSKIGSKQRLSTLEDDSKAAELCKVNYESIRDAVLRAYPWPCALERVQLQMDPVAPAFEYAHRYRLPQDCLRVLNAHDRHITYAIEGRFLLTDAEGIAIRYIRREDTEGVYDPLLVQAIATRLSAELAYPISGSTTLGQTKMQEYLMMDHAAKDVAIREAGQEEEQGYSWEEARY